MKTSKTNCLQNETIRYFDAIIAGFELNIRLVRRLEMGGLGNHGIRGPSALDRPTSKACTFPKHWTRLFKIRT